MPITGPVLPECDLPDATPGPATIGDDAARRVLKVVAAAGTRGQVLCLVVAVLALLAWYYDLRQPDRIGNSAAVLFILFLLLGLVAGPVRAWRDRVLWFRWSRAPLPSDDRPRSIGHPALRPPRLVWLLPALLVLPMLAMLPIYLGHHPAEPGVPAEVAALALLLGYLGLALGVVLWLVVFLSVLLVFGVVRSRTDGEGYARYLAAGRALLGAVGTVAVAITVAKLGR